MKLHRDVSGFVSLWNRRIAAVFLAVLLCCSLCTGVYAAGLPQESAAGMPALQEHELPGDEPNAGPANTPAPETAPVPETVPAPETTPTPETVPAPETAPTPETAPNDSAAPEKAPSFAPENSPEGDEEGEPVFVDLTGITLQSGGLGLADGQAAPYALARYSEQEVIQTLVNGMKNRSERIDISLYNVPEEDLQALMTRAINGAPELFFVESRYSYWPNSGGTVSAVKPSYNPDYTEEDSQRFEAAISRALQCVNDQMSPLQKALVLHDYLGQHIAYDQSLTRFDAYNALVNRSCVCQGYSLAYKLLLGRLGLACEVVTSDAMAHAWNAVQLNSQWYHVDITWDDPVPDKAGYVRHMYFLRSDAGFLSDANPHHDWTFSGSCTDTNYEGDIFWRSSNTAIIYDSDTAYYIDASNNVRKLMRLDPAGEPIVQYSFSTWPANSGGYYNAVFSGLSRIDNALYFNTSNTLYKLEIGSTEPVAVKTFSTAGEHLFGSYCHDGKAELCIGNDPNDKTFTQQQIDLPQPPPPSGELKIIATATSSMISGTAPKTTVAGFLPLARALAGEDAALAVLDNQHQDITAAPSAKIGTGCILKIGDAEYPVIVRGDVNGNASVEASDVLLVRRQILKIRMLEGVYLQAALITGNTNEPGVQDVLKMRRYILNIVDTLN